VVAYLIAGAGRRVIGFGFSGISIRSLCQTPQCDRVGLDTIDTKGPIFFLAAGGLDEFITIRTHHRSLRRFDADVVTSGVCV
jgi:hypothetical protein